MLIFVTDPERPRACTLAVAEALSGLSDVLVMLRDKRPALDHALLEVLAGPRLLVNVGARSAALARAHRALGWHAPESVWRNEPDRTGLMSVADHDGQGVAYADRHAIPLVLVSPIWIDKGNAARGVHPFRSPARALRVGLGGVVHAGHAAELAAAGAAGVAVQRALYAATDPRALAVALLAPFADGRSGHLSRCPLGSSLAAKMSAYDEILAITTEIMQRHVDGDRKVHATDHIQNDLGLDSLSVMEVVADIEDRFELTIPNDVLGAFGTVADVAQALLKLRESNASAS